MLGQLGYLDEPSVGRETREAHPVALQQLAIGVVELETVPVALEHDRLTVCAARERSCLEDAGIAPEAHRAAFVGDVALLREEIDHGVRRERVELRGVGVVRSERGTSELYDHALHAHAQAERGNTPLPAESGRLHLALDPAVTEAAGDDEPVEAHQRLDIVGALQSLAIDPLELDVAARCPRRVAHRLGDREVRVL